MFRLQEGNQQSGGRNFSKFTSVIFIIQTSKLGLQDQANKQSLRNYQLNLRYQHRKLFTHGGRANVPMASNSCKCTIYAWTSPNLIYERLWFSTWEVAAVRQVMMQSLEYPFLAGKWSLIPNVATIIRTLITAKKHQTAASFGYIRRPAPQRQVEKDFRVCLLPEISQAKTWNCFQTSAFSREQQPCRCWLGLGMLMNIVPLRCLGDWQRLGSDPVKPRVVQFGTLQSEAITGASMADWAQIQGSNKLYISFYRNRSGMGYGWNGLWKTKTPETWASNVFTSQV